MTKLYITDNNINDLDNCDYLTIIYLSISVNNNINLQIYKNYLYQIIK